MITLNPTAPPNYRNFIISKSEEAKLFDTRVPIFILKNETLIMEMKNKIVRKTYFSRK